MRVIIETIDGPKYLAKKHPDYSSSEGLCMTKSRNLSANVTYKQYENFVCDLHRKKDIGFFPQVFFVR